jgi:hypothetical protein
LERLEIAFGVIGNTVLPAAEQDPDPLKGYGAYGGMMAFTTSA